MRLQKKLQGLAVLVFTIFLLWGNQECIAAEVNTQDPESYKAEKMQQAYEAAASGISANGALSSGNYQHNARYSGSNIIDMIDVSSWSGDINWNKVKASGINYAIIRAGFRGYGSEGTLAEDTKFKANLKNARNAGVQVGIYFYSQAVTEEEARQEAEYVTSKVKTYELTLPVVFDFEYASVKGGLGGRLYEAHLSRTQATNVCKAFCDRVSQKGFVPMVYANRNMLEENLMSTSLESKYKIWLAEYNTTAHYQGFYEFWQYSDKATVDGINAFVDANFWYSGAAAPQPQPTKTVTKPGKVTITSASNKSGRKAALKWKKIKNVAGYQISYSTSKKFTNSKKLTMKSSKTSNTISKLKKNKTYYFRMRAYKKNTDGSKLYGSYGSTKKVKIKK